MPRRKMFCQTTQSIKVCKTLLKSLKGNKYYEAQQNLLVVILKLQTQRFPTDVYNV